MLIQQYLKVQVSTLNVRITYGYLAQWHHAYHESKSSWVQSLVLEKEIT